MSKPSAVRSRSITVSSSRSSWSVHVRMCVRVYAHKYTCAFARVHM